MTSSTHTISPLRQRMIDDMRMRKLSPKTQASYVRVVMRFAGFLGRSPDMASVEDLRSYKPLTVLWMLARLKITDKRQILAVRLVQDAVIDTQHVTLQIQEGRGLIVQIFAIIAFPLQKTGGTIVRDVHDFCQAATTALFGFAQ